MCLGGLLKAESGFATVAPVRVTTGQQGRLGNPHAVFIPAEPQFGKWNDHNAATVIPFGFAVKQDKSALMPALPKNATGKILKTELRKLAGK